MALEEIRLFFQYQTFDDVPGMVGSKAKLRAMELPPLKGKSFLDVGCNEGFYCGVALQAGASRVVGLDGNEFFIEKARQRFPRAEFLLQRWVNMPDERFDIVLFVSAMHYIPTPAAIVAMLTRLRGCLKRDGTLILEVGISPEKGEELVPYERRNGKSTVYYPTWELMEKIFGEAGLVERYIGTSESADGIERSVFHCSHFKQPVIFVRGRSNSGKTHMSHALNSGYDEDRYISVDQIGHAAFRDTFPEERYDDFDFNGARKLYARRPNEAAAIVARRIKDAVDTRARRLQEKSNARQAITVDGLDSCDPYFQSIFELAVEAMSDEYILWDSKRLVPSEPNYWRFKGPYFRAGDYLLEKNTARGLGRILGATAEAEEIVLDMQFDLPDGVSALRAVISVNGIQLERKAEITCVGDRAEARFSRDVLNTAAEASAGPTTDISQMDVRVIVELSDFSVFFMPVARDAHDWPFKPRHPKTD